MEKFIKEYNIRTYECDKNRNLRILTLMNILQDMADSHASDLQLGLEFCLQNGLAWVGSNYHLQIKRLPTLHENIKIVTWPSEEKKIGAVRDFGVYDEQGNMIIAASSQWVLIDFAKKRPVSLRDNLPDYQPIEERALDSDFPKIESLQRNDVQKIFEVRYDDIDVNKHVNNAVYPLWATESVTNDFRLTHQPEEIEIAFKKESLYGENIESDTQIDENISLHSLIAGDDRREVARLKITWKK